MGNYCTKSWDRIWTYFRGTIYHSPRKCHPHDHRTRTYKYISWWCFPLYRYPFSHSIYLWIYPWIRYFYLLSSYPHSRLWIWRNSRRARAHRDDCHRSCRRGILPQSKDCIVVCAFPRIYYFRYPPDFRTYVWAPGTSYRSSPLLYLTLTRRGFWYLYLPDSCWA